MAGLRVPVLVNRELYDSLKEYSQLTGVTMTRIVNDALTEYSETAIAARMETMSKKMIEGTARFVSIDAVLEAQQPASTDAPVTLEAFATSAGQA